MVAVLQWLLVLIGVYAAVGVGVAIWFVGWGAGSRDAAARSAPLRVRVLFAPGAVAIWPALLRKPGKSSAVETSVAEGG